MPVPLQSKFLAEYQIPVPPLNHQYRLVARFYCGCHTNPAAKHPAKTNMDYRSQSGLLNATRGPISPVLVIRISEYGFYETM